MIKMTTERFHALIREVEQYMFLSVVDVSKLTEEIFISFDTSINGITYEELDEFCSQIYAKTLQKWDKQTDFEEFVKQRYPKTEELQKLLIFVGPPEE